MSTRWSTDWRKRNGGIDSMVFVLARSFGRLPAELLETCTRYDIAELWMHHLSLDEEWATEHIKIR